MKTDKFFIQVKPVVDNRMRGLCRNPYPNHKRGCPNWDKKKGCPPSAPMITDTLDLSRPVFAIYNIFDFHSHVERMRKKHPEWTYLQLSCCLYWQPKARKQLKEKMYKFLELHRHKGMTIVSCPEGQGVNITETMKNVDIHLEWPPESVTYQIILSGYRKKI